MKQYCRYCTLCTQVDDDICYCEKSRGTFRGTKARRVNNCKDFVFNELDVFDIEHKYKPVESKKSPKRTGTQLSLLTD